MLNIHVIWWRNSGLRMDSQFNWHSNGLRAYCAEN